MRNQYLWWQRRMFENEGGAGGAAGDAGGAGGAGGEGDKGGAGGAGGAGGDGGAGDKGGGAAHWSLSLPEDLRGHEFVKGSKDLADFTKQSINQAALVGRKGVILPKEGAAAEDWNQVYDAIGRPKDITGYKVPERADKVAYTDTDKKFIEQMLPGLHKAGLNQQQLDGTVTAYNTVMAEVDKQYKAFADDSSKALDKEWGDKKPAMLAAAEKFAQKVWGDNFENMRRMPVPGVGFLLDHPMVIKALATAGQAMSEDGFGGAGGGNGNDPFASPEAAKAYVDGVYAEAEGDPKHWLNHPESAQHASNREYLQRVQKVATAKKS